MDPITFLILIAISWFFLILISNNKWVQLRNPEIGLGYALYRTKRFNNFLDRVAIPKRFWRFLFDVGVLVSLGFLIAAIVIFAINLIKFLQLWFISLGILPALSNDIVTVDLVPAIPGLSISFNTLPFFFIAIGIAAALHELAHGVAARVENIEVKSTGLMFFLFFFGAFVEPDEKSLKKATARQKLRVYSAGAFINLLIVIFFLILFLPPVFNLILTPAYNTTPQGALLLEVCPADLGNCAANDILSAGDIIIAGVYVNRSSEVIPIDSNLAFSEFSRGSIPDDVIELQLLNKPTVTLKTNPHPNNNTRGFIGVIGTDYYQPRNYVSFLPNQVPYWIFNIIFYTFSLSLVLALLNLLPIPPLDGDKIMSELLNHFGLKDPYLKWIRIGTLVIFLGNLVLTLVIRGWQSI